LILNDKGVVLSFGYGTSGKLGVNSTIDTETPTPIVFNDGKVKDIAVGTLHSLILSESGKAYAFGSPNAGRLGIVNVTVATPVPTPVTYDGNDILKVGAGETSSNFVTTRGTVIMFGNRATYGYTATQTNLLDPTELEYIYTCNAVPSTTASVCSKNGDCIGHDKCICDYGFTGTLCQTVVSCYELNHTDPTVCSGNGNCTHVDHCECEYGYISDNCSVLTCFNYTKYDAQVCSGHGECQSVDACVCDPDYTGSMCEEEIACFGKLRPDPTSCSGHGKCNSPNVCDCDIFVGTQYHGEQCQDLIQITCAGIHQSNSSVCSGHGKCISLDHCECKRGYYDETCSTLITTSGVRQLYASVFGNPVYISNYGELVVFGSNNFQELGFPESVKKVNPTRIEPPCKLKSIATGAAKTFFLCEDGKILAMGIASYLGINMTTGNIQDPVQVPVSAKIVSISASSYYTLLLDENGLVYSFGSAGGVGALGLNITNGNVLIPTVIVVPNSKKIVQISAGQNHGLLLDEEGTVYAFGYSLNVGNGQLTSHVPYPITVPIPNNKKIVQISAGALHSLVLDTDGKVYVLFCVEKDILLTNYNIDMALEVVEMVDSVQEVYLMFSQPL
jgi:alpha-tubulin suppressor-like RCC1 family protein